MLGFLIIGSVVGFFLFAYWLGKRTVQNEHNQESPKRDSISISCPYCFHINYVYTDDGYCTCEECGAFFQITDEDVLVDRISDSNSRTMSTTNTESQVFFTSQEYQAIIELLKELESTDSPSLKKKIRNRLRSNHYYISELKTNTVKGFRDLVKSGKVIVEEYHTVKKKPAKAIIKQEKTQTPKDVQSFPPVVDESSEILVLGTVPGNVSLATGEYYAQSGNLFWTIIQQLFNEGKPFSSYDEKIKCLKANHIALWDTLKACDRKGSTDNAIQREELNDIDLFLKQHPRIRKIVFNGKKPSAYYQPSVLYAVALSTSPANRNFSDEQRIQSWKDCLSLT